MVNPALKGLRVLMIGPGVGIGGGIATLVESFLPALEKEVNLFYLPSVSRRELKDSGKVSLSNIWIALSQYIRFLGALLRYRPRIIHLHTSQGIAWLKDTFYVLVGKVFRIRVILHMHGGNFDTLYEHSPRVIQRYTRSILKLSDALIAVSPGWKKRLEKIAPDSRVFVLNNCIDTSLFQPRCAEDKPHPVSILFLGRIGPLKGSNDLVEAFHLLQADHLDFHVFLVGPEEKSGEAQAARDRLEEYQLAKQCELIGAVPHERALELLNNADLFVLPSYYEGLPMVILEAIAAELPVIATAVGGIPDVVREGENGFLFQPGDVGALASRLKALIQDADLRRRMGSRSREIAEHEFDVSVFLKDCTSLYASLGGGGS